jgi:tRNA A-37 threonylcarbamoyl transferase component Bud32
LFSLTSLTELNVSRNSLANFPAQIERLQSLVVLDLRFNQISTIAPEVLSLPSLQQLLLADNPVGHGNLIGAAIQVKIRAVGGEPAVRRPQTSMSVQPTFRREEVKGTAVINARKAYQGVTEVDFSELTLGTPISQGGFSVVHRATWRGSQVAVKEIFDPSITAELRAEFENEVTMLSFLRHFHTVLLMGTCTKPPHLAVVTELVDCSLFEALHRRRRDVSMEVRLDIAKQVAVAMQFYHGAGVVHRDLKSHNVLLDVHYHVKICDFGLARFTADLNKGTSQFSGTPSYMAPELFRKQAYSHKVDIFAFGTLLWELISREIPYEALDPVDVKDQVLRDPRLPLTGPRHLVSLVDQCRAAEPNERPEFAEIVRVLCE